jgi:excisionase family DNA binding protein
MAIKINELEEHWLTVSQAAHRLGMTRQQTYRLTQDQRLRAAHVGRDAPGGRGVLVVEAASVERYGWEHGIDT